MHARIAPYRFPLITGGDYNVAVAIRVSSTWIEWREVLPKSNYILLNLINRPLRTGYCYSGRVPFNSNKEKQQQQSLCSSGRCVTNQLSFLCCVTRRSPWMWGRDSRKQNTQTTSAGMMRETKSGILLIKVFKLQLRCLIIWSCWKRINEAAQLPSAGDTDALYEYVYTQVCVCVCAIKALSKPGRGEDEE